MTNINTHNILYKEFLPEIVIGTFQEIYKPGIYLTELEKKVNLLRKVPNFENGNEWERNKIHVKIIDDVYDICEDIKEKLQPVFRVEHGVTGYHQSDMPLGHFNLKITRLLDELIPGQDFCSKKYMLNRSSKILEFTSYIGLMYQLYQSDFVSEAHKTWDDKFKETFHLKSNQWPYIRVVNRSMKEWDWERGDKGHGYRTSENDLFRLKALISTTSRVHDEIIETTRNSAQQEVVEFIERYISDKVKDYCTPISNRFKQIIEMREK